MTRLSFRAALECLLNEYSAENISNTPDFILSKYVDACLDAFNDAVNNRSKWYDCTVSPGGGKCIRAQLDARCEAEKDESP